MEPTKEVEKYPLPRPPSTGVLKANRHSPAAIVNAKLMKTLRRALTKNPEANLLSVFPPSYSQDLMVASSTNPEVTGKHKRPPLPPRDTRALLKETDIATIVSPLADEIQNMLDQIMAEEPSQSSLSSGDGEDSDDGQDAVSETNSSEHEDWTLSAAIIELLDRSEMLFQYPHGFSTMVLKVTEQIVVKLIRGFDNTTEYSSLQYLQDHAPDIPAPSPLGLVKFGRHLLMFSSFLPDDDLDKVWPQLDDSQKQDISSQLDSIFSRLRALPRPDKPLGGLQGEGCKDARRDIRICTDPIMTPDEFDEFVFSGPVSESPIYIQFFKDFIPRDPGTRCVFTHGDVRPANIRVVRGENGRWEVSGIIDWEFSGFYPEYWESLKITNTFMAFERSDWYQYLPKSLSPLRYPTRWLLNRIWGRFLDNY